MSVIKMDKKDIVMCCGSCNSKKHTKLRVRR